MHKNIENDIMNGLPWTAQTPADKARMRELLQRAEASADAQEAQKLREEAYALAGLYVDRAFLVTGTQPGATLSEARLLELTGLTLEEARAGEQMPWGPWRVIEGRWVVGSVVLDGEAFECMWQIGAVKHPDGYITPAEWARRRGLTRQAGSLAVAEGRVEGVIIHNGRYLIPEDAKTGQKGAFPPPKLTKTKKPKRPAPVVPEGMITMVEWARRNGVTVHRLAHLRNTGRLPFTEIKGRSVATLYMPENTPVPPVMRKDGAAPPEGYVSVSTWARRVGITPGRAQKLVIAGKIEGVIMEGTRTLIPENAELPQ